jgi:hypothetical protein
VCVSCARRALLIPGPTTAMPRTRTNRGRCVYCGAESQTADHVPPRCLFEQPRPQLITVPCCRRCNEAASKDDEYFRLVLAVHHKAGDHPDARGVRDAAIRSLEKPRKRRFARAFMSTVRPVQVRTPGGLYVETGAFNVDLGRLGNVMRRVVRGLFFHHHGWTCPAGTDAGFRPLALTGRAAVRTARG